MLPTWGASANGEATSAAMWGGLGGPFWDAARWTQPVQQLRYPPRRVPLRAAPMLLARVLGMVRSSLCVAISAAALGSVLAVAVVVSPGTQAMPWQVAAVFCFLAMLCLAPFVTLVLPKLLFGTSAAYVPTGRVAPMLVLSFDAAFLDKASGDEGICVVCLEALQFGEALRRLPCSHAFHAACIDAWWRLQPTATLRCAICRGSRAAWA